MYAGFPRRPFDPGLPACRGADSRQSGGGVDIRVPLHCPRVRGVRENLTVGRSRLRALAKNCTLTTALVSAESSARVK